MKKIARALAVPVFGFASAACGSHEAPDVRPVAAPASVRVSVAHREALPVLYRASGTVRGRNTATIASRTTAYVRTIHVHAGDLVAAGDVLAELEANDTRAAVARVRAALSQSIAAHAEAESSARAAHVAAELAQSNHVRMSELYAQQAVPKQQYDDAEARWQSAVAQEDAARARLRAVSSSIEEARAALAETQAAFGDSKITAPFAGRIVERSVDPGILASPGMPLFVLSDEGLLRVEAAVEEARTPDIHVGDSAEVEADVLGQPLAGTVSEVVPNVDAASRSFLVKLDLPATPAKLRPGMFARVNFKTGTESRLVVPATATSTFGAVDRVFVVTGGAARLRIVTRGETRDGWTVVLSGLSENESVIAAPSPGLEDGARVTVAL